MLSSQRNRLLFLANELESRYFNMNEYANAMRRAADTIWELRNKLAGTVDQSEEVERLKRENAELQQERDHLLAGESPIASEALADVRGWLCDNLSKGDAGKACGMLSVVSRNIVALEKENAKLRKLARGLNWCTENAKVPSVECEHCPLGDTFFECGELSCEKLMRELGIEEYEQ